MPINFLNIILFIIYLYGISRLSTGFMARQSFGSVILRLGIGLGTIPAIGVLLNVLKIPIDWKILCLLCSGLLLIDLKKILPFSPNIYKSIFTRQNRHKILIWGLILTACSVYISGAFTYPYLEDDDPWSHAAGIKYISIEKFAFAE